MGKKKSDKKDAKKAERKQSRALAAIGLRALKEPRIRRFPFLGWAIVLVPLDVFESRTVARMWIGTMYSFEPDEVWDLRARRIAVDDEPERTWWVLGIPLSAIERKERAKEQ